MDRWKSRGGKSQRREEQEREDQRRERVRRKKMQMREKVEKSRNTVFFQWFRAPEGRKVGSLSAEPCGQMRDEQLHALAARSTLRSQNIQNTSTSDRFWKLGCRKSERPCGAKHISKSKCYKTLHARTTFEGSDVILRGRRKGFCTLPKVSKTWGFYSISQNDGRRGTFAEDLQRCISRGRRSTRDMFIRDVRRSGRWFLERACILEHQIFTVLGRWFCVTGAALRMTWHHCFVAGAAL